MAQQAPAVATAQSPAEPSANHVSKPKSIESVDMGVDVPVEEEDSPDTSPPPRGHAPAAAAAQAACKAPAAPHRGHHSHARDPGRPPQPPFFLRHRFHGRSVHLMGLASGDTRDRTQAAAAAATFPRVLRCLLASTRAVAMLETYGEKALGRMWHDLLLPELATIARLAWQETGRELGEPHGGLDFTARVGFVAVLAVRNHLLAVCSGRADGILLHRPAGPVGAISPLEHRPLSAGSSVCEDGGVTVASHTLHYSTDRWCVLGSQQLWDRVPAAAAAQELGGARGSADAVQALLERARAQKQHGAAHTHGGRFATAAVLGLAECATMSAGAVDLE